MERKGVIRVSISYISSFLVLYLLFFYFFVSTEKPYRLDHYHLAQVFIINVNDISKEGKSR